MTTFAALLPTIVLMWYVYKKDKIEKEPAGLIFKVFIFGALSVFPAMIMEEIAEFGMILVFMEGSLLYILVENFFGVALIEEYVKRFAVRKGVWMSAEFDYVFDGIVYSVASALGFATLENLLYVMDGGLGTAVMRAITAVPVHAAAGAIMGVYLGRERKAAFCGDLQYEKHCRRMSLWYPTMIHGIYDAALSLESDLVMLGWVVFVIVLDIRVIRCIKKASQEDEMIFEK